MLTSPQSIAILQSGRRAFAPQRFPPVPVPETVSEARRMEPSNDGTQDANDKAR